MIQDEEDLINKAGLGRGVNRGTESDTGVSDMEEKGSYVKLYEELEDIKGEERRG